MEYKDYYQLILKNQLNKSNIKNLEHFKKDNYIGYFIVKKDDLKLPNNGCPIKK